VKTVSLREHETIPVGGLSDGKYLTVVESEALDRAQRFLGIEAFRWISRNQIKAAQYVGMIAAADVRLEILPKIEGLELGETRQALIGMLSLAWNVPVRDGEITGHDYQNCDLLELLMGLFARRLRETIRAGLSRAYSQHEADLSCLRGKLAVTRQFTNLAASPNRLACRYDEFTADIFLNRLLLCAVTFLRRRSIRAETQRLLNEIAAHFEDVQSASVSDVLSRPIILDRANRAWEIPAKLARLLLSAAFQTAHSGARDGVALLFDMNLLFESYVAAFARRVCVPLGYRVRAQCPVRCLARDKEGRGLFHTKPDLHLERDGQVVVLDTKWKHIDPRRSNFEILQADAYQMYGYAHIYASQNTILLYPHNSSIPGPPGLQRSWQFESHSGRLTLATVDVTKPATFAASLTGLLTESKLNA
jgi:5-methylcytosine-specific restriction enzyme subunit McrC